MVRSPSCQCCFVCGTGAGFVSFPGLEVRVDGSNVLMAAVGDFTRGQSGSVHHVPFGMPRHFPTSHINKATPATHNSEEV